MPDIYYKTYERIEAETAAYAKENGIDLVIRVYDVPVDPNKPDSITQYINKPVVWFSPQLDITNIISEQLDKRKDASEEKSK